MARYIYQLAQWPRFEWELEIIAPQMAAVRYQQGRLLGRMEALGFKLREEANLQNLALDIIKSSEIEGEILDTGHVKSSLARRLGLEIAGMVPSDRYIDGVVEMMLDATQECHLSLTHERLFGWQAALFPTGRSGPQKIVTGAYRDNEKKDPMRVVSGGMGREQVHFEAPDSDIILSEMTRFLEWFNNTEANLDPLIKAAIAHLWFVTINPFEDGNGRIARAIADMQLALADESSQRFYSMSAQIRKERNTYYDILESTQKGGLDISAWLQWFLGCLGRALTATDTVLQKVLVKAGFWERHAKTVLNQRQVSMINKLLDGFEGKLTSSKWAAITKCSQDTALRDIQDLLVKNVMVKQEAGGRSTGYELVL